MAFAVRQYKPGGEFVVVRGMDYGSRHFEAGDLFPWREMGVHEAQVQMLWKAVRLEVKLAPTAAPAVKAPAPQKPAAVTSNPPPRPQSNQRR